MYIVAPDSRGNMTQDMVYVPFNFFKFPNPEFQKTSGPKVLEKVYGYIIIVTKYKLNSRLKLLGKIRNGYK